MGTLFTITVYAPSKPVANTAARAAFKRIEELNGILSDYDPNSELSRLGRTSGPGKPVKVSRELLFVLANALEVSRKSNGAFDVTVGHLTRQWRRARRRKKLPTPETLADALAKTGYRHVRIDPKRRTVELMKTGMRLDLGGIAKGYAGDEAMKVLRKQGLTRALVDGGGDVTIGEPPPGKTGWKIGIASLKKPDAPPDRFLILKNAAVATSGDAYQFVEIAGRRYSHIVDPKTGLGLAARSSVTVIAPTGVAADSLASAVTVLGPKRGVKLIDATADTETLVLQLVDGKTVETSTAGFSRLVLKPARRD
jgi:thiamine biosynthesis lipoprotein